MRPSNIAKMLQWLSARYLKSRSTRLWQIACRRRSSFSTTARLPILAAGKLPLQWSGDPSSSTILTHRKSLYDHSRSEEHTSELQSLMRISYAVFCLKKKYKTKQTKQH